MPAPRATHNTMLGTRRTVYDFQVSAQVTEVHRRTKGAKRTFYLSTKVQCSLFILQKPYTCLHDIQPAIAFATAEEFARANADEILIGHAAVATFTEVIFNSCQSTGTICNSEAAIGR